MKKIIIPLASVFAILILVVAVFCLKPVSVNCGSSELFSEDEIQSAAEFVKAKFFRDFDGCKLISLSFAGDDKCLKEADGRTGYDKVIVFKSVFLSPIRSKDAGAWEPHSIYYDFSFTVGIQAEGNQMVLLECGYA